MTGILYKDVIPPPHLGDWVDSFWMLQNTSGGDREIVLLPDGRIDASFMPGRTDSFMLHGLDVRPTAAILPAGMIMYCVSFRLLAPAYIFADHLPGLVDSHYQRPPSFLGLHSAGFTSFEEFCGTLSLALTQSLPPEPDPRHLEMSRLIYASKGSVRIGTLAREVYWSARQMNRYFNHWLGLPLKEYCDILRFRASFPHIKQGKLYPDPDFADQSHFIRHIRRLSGVTPKELFRNQNDRFIQFSTLQP